VTGEYTGAVSLRAWAAEAEAAAGIARALAPTPFVPEQLRRYVEASDPRKPRVFDFEATVATVTAVLLAGQELGFGPMASLRSITIIKGTVGLYALAARALLQQHGHEIVVRHSDSVRAVVDGRRAGGEWQRSTWHIDRAKAARLYPGTDNSNWRTQTQAMLVARATAEAARWVASDAMLGLPLLVEEIEDAQVLNGQVPAIGSVATGPEGPQPGTGPAEIAPPEPAAKATTTKRRAAPKRAALPAAAPAPDPPAPIPPDPVPPPAGITQPARAKILAGLREMQVTGREESLALISAWLGRTVTSTSDLSQDESHVIIDRVKAVLASGAASTAQDAEEQPPPPDDDDQPDPPPDDDDLDPA
jgi:hypothetical protein